jgi:hypothetical protein
MARNQLFHERVHPDASQGIERRERFVEKKEFRFLDQRAGERDALGLPAGEISWPVIEPIAEADLDQRRGGAFACIGNIKTERNVSPERIPWQQPMFLKHDGWPAWRVDAPALNRIKARERTQQRGLATSALAQEGDELSARDTQVEPIDDYALRKGTPQAGHDHSRGSLGCGESVKRHRALP